MTKFSDLNLDPKVLKAIEDAGYETPTPIQAGAIPPALQGRDVLGIAQTGTGKTASFTLPMITRLSKGRARARMPRSLVLAPTRELAAQVAENFDAYSKYVKLSKALLIGGVSFKEQDQLIDNAGAMGTLMLQAFRERLGTAPGVVSIRGQGLMIGIELDRPCAELMQQALARKLLINVTADSVVRLLPPLTLTHEQAQTIVATVSELIETFLGDPQ